MSLLEKLQSISNSKKIMSLAFILISIAIIALAISAMVTSKPVISKPTPSSSSSASSEEAIIVNPDLVARGRKMYYEFCLVKPSENPSQRKNRLTKYIYNSAPIPEALKASEIKSRDCTFYEGGGIFLSASEESTILQIHANQMIAYSNGSKESKEVYAKLVLVNDNGVYKVSDISY